MATLAGFWWAHSRTEGAGWAWHGMIAASALAVLAKGLIGLVIPGAVIFLYLLVSRRWRVLKKVPWITGSTAANTSSWVTKAISRSSW